MSKEIKDENSKSKKGNINFINTLQNKGTMDLALVDGTMFGETNTVPKGNISITINGTRVDAENGSLAKQLNTSTLKLFDILVQKFSSSNTYGNRDDINKEIVISLDDYLDMTGNPHTRPAKNNARIQIKKNLDLLYGISLNWEDYDGTDYRKIRLVQEQGITNGKIHCIFSQKFADSLVSALVLKYPSNVLQLKSKHAYYLGRKLASYATVNEKNSKDGIFVISVKCLLESCPSLPSYEEIKASKKGNYRQRIQEPFEKAMDELEENMFYWQYCNQKRKPLTQWQEENFKFDVFYNSYIMFSYNEKNLETYFIDTPHG